MHFHDIELHNVRKIDSLSITGLDERGVVVISGDNESGKTTIADAIHMALTAKWKSGRADVLSLSNHKSQEKPQVKLRMELGGYEFTLDKVFGRVTGCGTVITVHAPSAATYKDEAAEEWLEARMRDADTKNLWDVFVAEQGKAQKTLSFGGYTRVTSALQSASGQRAETAEEVGLFEAVEKEYNYFYTAGKGTPRKPLIDVDEALEKAEKARADAAQKVHEFNDLNSEAARLDESQKSLRAQLPQLKAEVERWAKALVELEEFRAVVAKAEEASAGAKQQLVAAENDKKEREEAIRQVNAARESATAAQQKATELKEKADAETEELQKARERRDAVAATYRQARAAEELATAEVTLGDKRNEVEALSARVAEVKALREQLTEHNEVLNRSRVTDKDIEKLLDCQSEVKTATAVLEASSPKVELTARTAQQISVDGDSVELAPEAEPFQSAVTKPLTIEIGDVTVAVEPGDGSDSQQLKLDKAIESLSKQLEAAGVADLAEAQEVYARRQEAEKAKFQVEASIKAESGGVDYHQLVDGLEQSNAEARALSDRYRKLAGKDAPEVIDLPSAKEKLADAAAKRKQAEGERDSVDKLLTILEKRPAHEKYTAAASEAVGLQSTHSERAGMLELAREKASDAEVFATVENRAKDFRVADEQLSAAKKELARRDADDAEASLAGAQQRYELSEKRLTDDEGRRRDIGVRLEGFESANETLAQAESAVRLAERKHYSTHRRAAAATTLYEAMVKARMASRDVLAVPLLRKLEEYGGKVFGPGTTFTMDSDLTIKSRSNEEGEFRIDALSGGAQEQLDILLRLAAAGVMEGGQGAPVIIDDALGYSDEERLRLMNIALSKAGKDMQVIVLTCDEDRFIRIQGMKHLRIQDLLRR